jgi:GNAT superfamily N-acetyltransferase
MEGSCVSDCERAYGLALLNHFLGINMMSVLPEHQGKGLGSMLLGALIGEGRARGVNVALAGASGKFDFRNSSKGRWD